MGLSEALKCQRSWKKSGRSLWRSLLATFGVSSLLSLPNVCFLHLFCLSSLSQSRANYSMSSLSNSEVFVPLALRLIGFCGLLESRCYIIDAVSLFSVYRQYTNKLPPLWLKHWACVCVCVCLCVTCSVVSQFSHAHTMFSFSQGSVVLGPYFCGGRKIGCFCFCFWLNVTLLPVWWFLLIIANRIIKKNDGNMLSLSKVYN